MSSNTHLAVASLLALSLVTGCPSDPAPSPDASSARDVGRSEADAFSGTDDAALDGGPPDPCAEGACGPCDMGLALDDGDAMRAAQAMGVCSGLVSAAWQLPDGAAPPSAASFALGHGLLDDFGVVTPREGARLLGLSTGTARAVTDPGYVDPAGFDKGYTCSYPPGFPFEPPACPGVTTGSPADGIALTLTLDVPAGANGFRLLLKHHNHEFPSFLCSSSNDIAAVLVSPPPPGAASNGDVTLDGAGNPLSVNSSFVDVCGCAGGPPCTAAGRSFACAAGRGELAGTGFDAAGDAGAATRWLEVRVPAVAGERVEVRLTVWDSGDGLLDSTLLADGFRWLTDAPATTELRVHVP